MADDGNKPQSEKKSWVKAEGIVQIAFMMPLALVVGYFAGSWLDEKFHTTWIKMVGLLLGIAAGFVQLIRIAGTEGKK
jgi:ATP synthase protein I